MKGALAEIAVAGLFVGSILWAAVTDMCKDEVRTRLDRLPYVLIRVAALRVPGAVRSDLTSEWDAELDFILHGTEDLPLTRLLRGVNFSADLLLRGAPAVAREITAVTVGTIATLAPAQTDTRWSSLFPAGRHIFYEGHNPAGFARQVLAEFGFRPDSDPRWGEQFDDDDLSFTSYSFHCPPEHLDAIYGGDRFPMGS
jgi:hypothetical protein